MGYGIESIAACGLDTNRLGGLGINSHALWLSTFGIPFMLFLKRFCLAALPLVSCLPMVIFSGCAEPSTVKRFIFITNGDDPFWDACNAGLIEGG